MRYDRSCVQTLDKTRSSAQGGHRLLFLDSAVHPKELQPERAVEPIFLGEMSS
jgi:hypothetical protein